ncbi:hypothetical protein [Alteribacillus sp. HJP-4]|uniref:hypothetical protein n=1 Tax=Alteribacillus sp. HJP-4 TaxID=2775394 RepID=UPI0035CD1C16
MKENIWMAMQALADGKSAETVIAGLSKDEQELLLEHINNKSPIPLGDMWV